MCVCVHLACAPPDHMPEVYSSPSSLLEGLSAKHGSLLAADAQQYPYLGLQRKQGELAGT